jgi:hypothetical protein
MISLAYLQPPKYCPSLDWDWVLCWFCEENPRPRPPLKGLPKAWFSSKIPLH